MKRTKITITLKNGEIVTSHYCAMFITLQDALCNLLTNMGYSPKDVLCVK